MDANIVNLNTLFGPEVSYRIPQFQRPYAWEQELQWEPLWEDVRTVAERWESDETIRPHFMGAIVLQDQKSSTGVVAKKLVIDGQQRLTTLQLLIKAAQQVFQGQDDTVRADRLRKLTTNQESHWGEDSNNETKIRQSNTNDQQAFQEAIRDNYIENQYRFRPINRAYRYFEAEVRKWLDSETESRATRADALEATLTEHLQIAVIDLDQDEKPHIIFETLNARGMPLKQSDLIKNTVMYEADVTDDAQKARELWGMFDDEWWRKATHEGRLSRIHIDRFLNYWMVMRTLKDVTADRVASEFRNYIQDKLPSIEIVAADIRFAGKNYKELEEIKIPEIKTFLERMKVIELGVVTPLLLWLYTSKVLPEQLIRSIEALESYVVRRLLRGYQSQGLNKFFISLLEKLDSAGPDHADSTIIRYLKSQTVANRIWPNDRILYTSLTNEPMPGTNARKKMILEAIEMSLRSDKSEPLGATDKLTVEHIMPQKWEEKNWPMPTNDLDNTEAEEARAKAIKNIGNLTLTTGKLNASLSNGPWSEKRETLDKHSSLFLNKRLLENAPNHWNEEAIQERSAYLVEKIIQIWSSADKFTETSA